MKAAISFVLCLACVSIAQADERRLFRISGFGTAAASFSSTNQADYRVNVMQPTGVGYSNRQDLGMDSKLGAQLDVFLSPRLTGTIQALAQRTVHDDYTPGIEWANIKYLLNDAVYVRAGRIGAPVYMISDYRNVAYSLTSVRPANDVYAHVSLFSMDGIDAGYQTELGKATLNIQAVTGRFHKTITGGGLQLDVGGKGQLYNVLLEYGDTTFRAGFGNLRVSLETPDSGLFHQFDAALEPLVNYGVPGAAIVRSNFYFEKMRTRLFGIGINHDTSSCLAQSELIYRKSTSAAIPDIRAWYVLAGYRWHKLTPYVSYSANTSINDKDVPVVDATGYPAEFQAAAGGVNAITRQFLVPSDQTTLSLGMRYDVKKNMDLKLQVDRVSKPEGSFGLFNNPQPGFASARQHVFVASVALDFIF